MPGASLNWNKSGMAKDTTKTEPEAEADDILADFAPEPALDGAIDDLRGVLQNDAEGTLPELGDSTDFDFDATADATAGEADLSQFGGDFGGDVDMPGGLGGNDFGGDFGGGAGGHSQAPGSALHANLDLIMDIPIELQIVLGNSHMHVATLMNLTEGATIALDRKIGDPVEVIVNGRLIGRGEITVLESDNTRFGVKMIEVNAVKKKQG
jgi:flagellar motor switch protein FliN